MIKRGGIVETDKKGCLTSESTREVLGFLIELQDRVVILESKSSQDGKHLVGVIGRIKDLEAKVATLDMRRDLMGVALGLDSVVKRLTALEERGQGISEMAAGDIRLRLHDLELRTKTPPKTCGTCRFMRDGRVGQTGCWRFFEGKAFNHHTKESPACPKHEAPEDDL